MLDNLKWIPGISYHSLSNADANGGGFHIVAVIEKGRPWTITLAAMGSRRKAQTIKHKMNTRAEAKALAESLVRMSCEQ
jgi:hypothetical protein